MPSVMIGVAIGNHQLFWTTYAITYRAKVDGMRVYVSYDFSHEMVVPVEVLEYRGGKLVGRFASHERPAISTKWELLGIGNCTAIGGRSNGTPIVLCLYQSGVGRIFPGPRADPNVMRLVDILKDRLAPQQPRQ